MGDNFIEIGGQRNMDSLKIKVFEEEYWYGGSVEDGVHMPFGKNIFKSNLSEDVITNQIMPLLVSSKGRYIWCNTGFAFEFKGNELEVTAKNSPIVFEEGYADLKGAYKAACMRFFKPMGKIPKQELFTLPQYNTWIELMYEQEETAILNYAQSIIDNGFPPGILMIDDNWQEDYGVWEFSKNRFKDPKGMIEKLHKMGFLVMLWTCPFVSPDSMTARKLMQGDLLLKGADGKTAIRSWWNGYSAVLDFTNPKSVEWYDSQLKKLMDEYKVDGFKFDAGDPYFYRDDDETYVRMTALEHCNCFASFGQKYELNEYRSSFRNGLEPLAQRLGDKNHSWDKGGLASLIPNGLAQGLMGYIFTCPDMIGGGQVNCFMPDNLKLDEELVVRYAECSALFPMMQFSVAPWRILSKENLSYCLNAAKLHESFGEYILETAKASSESGEPIIRHMCYSFGKGYEECNDMFMLGEDYLVAPVIEKGKRSRLVNLPEGKWVSDDERTYEGPCSIEVEAPLGRVPYFRRKK